MAKDIELEENSGADVMTKPIPQVVDEVWRAIKEAKAAAVESKQHALTARTAAGEAGDAVVAALRKELADHINPRLADAQREAGEAKAVAKSAQASSELNSESIIKLAGTVKELGERFIRFVTSYLNRSKEKRSAIMQDCSEFISIEPEKK